MKAASPMTASLPMYDWPETRAATDAWWRGIARALRAQGLEDIPGELSRDDEVDELWCAPGLLLSQSCGYPLTHAWAGRLQVVGTPHYDAEGCEGPDYCSFVLARHDDARDLEEFGGAVAAYNGADSQSGFSALRSVIAPLAQDGRFFGGAVCSGSHLNSMRLVASGGADLCAVDAVCWTLARRHHSGLAGQLRPVVRSAAVPGLPFVMAPAVPQDRLRRLRAALKAAFDDPDLAGARQDLLLAGMTVTDASAYQPILDMEAASLALGYAWLE